MNHTITRALTAALVVFAATQTASAQLVSPAAPAVAPTTIWNRLGIPYGFNKIRDNRVNRRGNNPQLERTPRLKAIADPANLESPNSAIKKAAEVKAQEDLAPQKIKAIKYLAKMGCGCYDKTGEITAALLESLSPLQECTPDVRLATIEAIKEAVEEAECPCSSCGSTCCCNEEIALALSKSAYERDDTGCYYEPNAEVRQAAAELLRICCPGRGPVNIIELPEEPPVGPEMGPKPEGIDDPDVAPVPEDVTRSARSRARGSLAVQQAPLQFRAPQKLAHQPTLTVAPVADSVASVDVLEVAEAPVLENLEVVAPVAQPAYDAEENYEGLVEIAVPPMLPVTRVAASKPTKPALLRAPQPTRTSKPASFATAPQRRVVPAAKLSAPRPTQPATAQKAVVRQGRVAHVDSSNGIVHLQFGNQAVVPVGTKLNVNHTYLTGKSTLGQVEIVQSSRGAAVARSVGFAKTWKMAAGDEAVITR